MHEQSLSDVTQGLPSARVHSRRGEEQQVWIQRSWFRRAAFRRGQPLSFLPASFQPDEGQAAYGLLSPAWKQVGYGLQARA